MTDHEKNKVNLFAGDLRPTEKILWLSMPVQPKEANPVPIIMIMTLLFTGSIAFIALANDNMPPGKREPLLLAAGGFTVFIFVFTLILRAARKYYIRNRKFERVYALTNERLLYRNKKNVASIPLETLPSVSLFLGDGTQGTFSFGALFPMWPDVEDAVSVKRLIDDAQKKRMQQSA